MSNAGLRIGEVRALVPGCPASLLRDRQIFPCEPGAKRRYTAADLDLAEWLAAQVAAGASVEGLRRLSRVTRLGPGCTGKLTIGQARSLRRRRRSG